MNASAKLVLWISAAAMLGSCSTTPVEQVSCLPSYRADNMQIIDDWTILFRDGRTIYVQNPRGGCPGIGSRRNILVNRVFGTNQLCSGDISHLLDPVSGIQGGACVFGDFVPYTKPAA
jgi:hypothetical protein